MISLCSGAFCNAGILEFAAAPSELGGDRQPAVSAVAGGSFGGERSNIVKKKVKKFLLGIRYHQKLLFFFVFQDS